MKFYTFCSLVLLPSIFFIFYSCKEDNITDRTENLSVYMAPGSSAYNIWSGGTVTTLRGAILSQNNTSSFPVLLTRPFEQDVTVTANIDTSLIKEYDNIYKPAVPSPPIPAGTFKLLSDKVTIKAGKVSSSDSLQLQLADAKGLRTGNNSYIIPIVLQMADNNIPISNKRQVMYIKIEVTSISVGITSIDNKNAVDILLSNSGGLNMGINTVYLRGLLNKGIPTATSITVKDDLSLVPEFNRINGTNYRAFPTGSYRFDKNTGTIPINQVLSKDSIAIRLTDLSLFDKDQEYLLPITIVDEPKNPAIEANRSVVYIHVDIFENNIDPSNSGLTGSFAGRTGWSVKVSGKYSGNIGENILDGNNNTSWDSDGRMPAWMELNMGTSLTIKGFSIVPNYVYKADDILAMDIYSSTNGILWKLEGKYNGTPTLSSSSPSAPDLKIIRFLRPVTARYYKFNITKSTDRSYTGMAELQAVQ